MPRKLVGGPGLYPVKPPSTLSTLSRHLTYPDMLFRSPGRHFGLGARGHAPELSKTSGILYGPGKVAVLPCETGFQ